MRTLRSGVIPPRWVFETQILSRGSSYPDSFVKTAGQSAGQLSSEHAQNAGNARDLTSDPRLRWDRAGRQETTFPTLHAHLSWQGFLTRGFVKTSWNATCG